MVCMPTGRDQPDNAAQVRHHGAGVTISKRASPGRIAESVQRVLGDPSYRINAARVGDRLLAEVADGAVLRELEGLVHPPASGGKGRDRRKHSETKRERPPVRVSTGQRPFSLVPPTGFEPALPP